MEHFLYMNGHGVYVWSAYGSVLLFLVAQWLTPWHQWRQYLKQQKSQ